MKMITTILLMLAFPVFSLESGCVSKREVKEVTVTVDHEAEIREVLAEEDVTPYVTELLIAQSKHESGNYKNSLTKYHNVFARHYQKSDTFAISAGAKAEGHSRFAIYPSIKNATLSQLWYLKRKNYSFKWKSPREFALELKSKRYYEAPVEVYTAALNKFMKK
jgi:hypothetical protein